MLLLRCGFAESTVFVTLLNPFGGVQMNQKLHSVKSGAVAAVLAAALGFATPASSAFFSFSTPAGATAGGLLVDAQADFTTGAGTIQLVLTNFQANPTSIIQAISDLFFTASNGATNLTTGTALYTYAGNHITIAANGTSSASAAPAAAAWNLSNTAGTYHLDKLCGSNTCGNPEGLIIGPGPYTNAKVPSPAMTRTTRSSTEAPRSCSQWPARRRLR